MTDLFTQGLEGGDVARTALLRSQDVPQAVDRAEQYFDWLRDRERGADRPLPAALAVSA